jgi:cytochrome b561
MSSAKSYSVSWFGAFSWPNLIEPDEAAFNFLKALHHLLSNLLFAIGSLHILAALKHHFWNKDAVLIRMLPGFQSEDKSSTIELDRGRERSSDSSRESEHA